MRLAQGMGLYLRRGQYGVIEKCPHCDRTEINRLNSAQVTCGREGCRVKQAQAARQRKKAARAAVARQEPAV